MRLKQDRIRYQRAKNLALEAAFEVRRPFADNPQHIAVPPGKIDHQLDLPLVPCHLAAGDLTAVLTDHKTLQHVQRGLKELFPERAALPPLCAGLSQFFYWEVLPGHEELQGQERERPYLYEIVLSECGLGCEEVSCSGDQG